MRCHCGEDGYYFCDELNTWVDVLKKTLSSELGSLRRDVNEAAEGERRDLLRRIESLEAAVNYFPPRQEDL